MKTSRSLLIVLLGASLALGACSKKSKGGDETTSTATTPETNGSTDTPNETTAETTGAATTPTAPGKVEYKVDPTVIAAVDALLKDCPDKLSGFDQPDFKCKEPREAFRKFMYDKRFDSFETLVSLFVGDDENKSRLAGWALNTYTRSYIRDAEKDKSKVRPEVVAALTAKIVEQDPTKTYRAQNGMAIAVLLNGILGKSDVAIATIKHFDPAKDMRTRWAHTSGLPHVMTYARMAGFDFVKEQAESAESTVMSSAFSAPRAMNSWTEEEETTICTWAESKLGEEKKKGHPAYILLNCKRGKDKYRPMIVDEAKKRAGANTLDTHMTQALRDVCYTMPSKEREGDAQCARVKTLLTLVLKDKKADAFVRTTALSSLAWVWPTPEHLKLAQEYAKHPDKKIAKSAELTAKTLGKRIETMKKLGKK